MDLPQSSQMFLAFCDLYILQFFVIFGKFDILREKSILLDVFRVVSFELVPYFPYSNVTDYHLLINRHSCLENYRLDYVIIRSMVTMA